MTNQQKVAYEVLKGIMKICKDGEKGYRNAADNVNEGNINTLFVRMAQQRATFHAELENEMRILFGKEPEIKGSWSGAIHRLWQDTKATFSGDSAEEIIEECIRGEKAAIRAYKSALEMNDLPEAVRDRLKDQYRVITSTLVQMELLEEAVD